MPTLAQRVYRACHLEGEFVLRSGAVSHEYFDKYRFESDPELLRGVAAEMAALLPPCDVVAGMELGGIPPATMVAQLTGVPCVFVRKRAKDYGTRRLVEGIDVEGLRVVGIEDVVTTAGALVAGCEALRSVGAVVDVAVCAIDRDEGGADALAGIGVELRAVWTRSTFAQSAAPNA